MEFTKAEALEQKNEVVKIKLTKAFGGCKLGFIGSCEVKVKSK